MKLYLMEMWRFGDDIQVIASNKRNGYSALKKEYFDIYEKWNGEKPTAAEWKETRNDIEVREFILNEVFIP